MGPTGFGHINMRAPRALLDQLYIFYTTVIGLTEGRRPPFNRFGYWLYLGKHDIVHLIEASPEEQRATHVVTTIDHIAFLCEGLAEFESKLKQLGISYDTAQVPLTGQLQLVIKDPAGNKVELNFPNTGV
ncbi:MAG TPA: VOC family protein [Methylophilaceae bacterium]|jgi:catechol 2,3-dioxygenase-like lactoylglutathione lyase family enzyme